MQEIRWPRKNDKNEPQDLCSGHKSDKHEFGIGFYISRYYPPPPSAEVENE
jgi:hypothetical protein